MNTSLYYIYKTTNKINGKNYIGQHRISSPKTPYYIGSGKLLLKAIKKYGKENFENEIIYVCTEDNVDLYEMFFIAYFKAKGKAEYNIEKGGKGCKSNTIEKMSKSHRNRKHTEESKRKISNSKLGHFVSEESKEKMRKAKIGKSVENGDIPFESSIKKSVGKVICIETNEVYNFANEASKKTGVNVTNILRCCHGTRKTAGGYHWQFFSPQKVG